MKSDSERQTEYQKRRRETEDRITIWVPKEIEHAMDVLRGNESRTTWINRAITELTIRQLNRNKLSFTNAELKTAQKIGKKLGIIIPD